MNLNEPRRKRILYVDRAQGIGGSHTNVLYPTIAGLDQEQYEPIVLFYWPNPYREQLEAAGIKTIVFDIPSTSQHPATVARFQKNRMVRDWQQSEGQWSNLYHNLGSYVRLGYSLPQIFRLVKIMKEQQVDLVHLNNNPAGRGREIILAAKLTGAPFICYAQNFSEFWAADRQVARLIDQYVFCSNAIGKHCITLGGAVPAKSRTIYPGVVDVEKWSQSYNSARIRRELGLSEHDFVIGNIGRLTSWKGQDVFLKALAEVKQEAPDIKAIIVGGPTTIAEAKQSGESADFYEYLVALTESLGLVDNVLFTGFRSNIPEILSAIDIFVHSSSEPEPFSTAVIEAMMAGCPVVATRAGGMPEMINHGVTGLLVTIKDSQVMAEAILTYYREGDKMNKISLAGQKRAREDLTAQRHAREFYDLYQTILA